MTAPVLVGTRAALRQALRSGPGPLRTDRGLVALLSVVLLALCFLPILAGFRGADPDWRFVGWHVGGLNDYQGYLAWIRQAQDGHLLFTNLFTGEEHGRVILQPMFWLLGALSRWTGMNPLAWWYGAIALGIVLAVVAIERFFRELGGDRSSRRLALVLACTASGLGWLVPATNAPITTRPIDLWLVEANLFQAVNSSFFPVTLGLAFLFFSAAAALRYLRSGRLADAARAGVWTLGLATVHAYDAIVLYAVVGVWTLLAGRDRWPGLLVLVACSAPYLGYAFLALRLDPVLAQIDFSMPMPTLLAVGIGWGLLLLLALAAPWLRSSWRRQPRLGLVLLWIAVQITLLALPFDFRRKLLWGLHPMLCLLASCAALAVLDDLEARLGSAARGWRRLTAAVVLVALAGGSMPVWLHQFSERSLGRYLPDDAFEAFRFLEQNTAPGEVVLGGEALAGFVPGKAGRPVFWGHWAMTADAEAKKQLVDAVLTPGLALDAAEVSTRLRQGGVRFIMVDFFSVTWLAQRPWEFEELDLLRLFPSVFESPRFRILEVPPDESVARLSRR